MCPVAHPETIVNVHLLPELANPHELAGLHLVVIDVLRATTTIAAALSAGAAEVVPCLEVSEARNLARQRRSTRDVVLGGERGGKKIADFDLGNSPVEYTSSRVKGKTVVFTSTNGTRAMMRCIGAGRVFLGCFANLTPLIDQIASAPRVDLICAGTDGQVSWEDSLFAGAVCATLGHRRTIQTNDAARVARCCWESMVGDNQAPTQLAGLLRRGRGGQNLSRLELHSDIDWVAGVDRLQIVPELYLADWSIRPAAADP